MKILVSKYALHTSFFMVIVFLVFWVIKKANNTAFFSDEEGIYVHVVKKSNEIKKIKLAKANLLTKLNCPGLEINEKESHIVVFSRQNVLCRSGNKTVQVSIIKNDLTLNPGFLTHEGFRSDILVVEDLQNRFNVTVFGKKNGLLQYFAIAYQLEYPKKIKLIRADNKPYSSLFFTDDSSNFIFTGSVSKSMLVEANKPVQLGKSQILVFLYVNNTKSKNYYIDRLQEIISDEKSYGFITTERSQ